MAKTAIRTACAAAVVVLACGWLFRGFLQPGVPVLLDHPVHYAEFLYLIQNLLPVQGWVSGWCDLQMAGFPMLITYSIFGYTPAVLLHFAGVNSIAAYKCAVFGGYVFAALALFFFLRRRASASAAGLSTLLWSLSPLAVAPCAYGLWHQYWGIGFFLAALGQCRGRSGSDARRIALLATVFALTLISHAYSAIALAVWYAAWLMVKRRGEFPGPGALACAGILAVLLSAFYLGPFLESAAWLRPAQESGQMPFSRIVHEVLALMWRGNWPLSALALAGIGTLIFRRMPRSAGDSMTRALLLFLALCLAGSVLPWRGLHLHGGRALLYAALPAAAFAALALDVLGTRIRLMVGVPLAAVFAWTVLSQPSPFVTDSALPEREALEEVRAWIGKQPDSVRGLVQSTVGNAPGLLGQSHITALNPFLTGRPQVGDWIGGTLYPHEPEFLTESGLLFGLRPAEVSNMELLARFQTHNIRWAVACEPSLQGKLENTGFFRKELASGPFSVYSLQDIFYNPIEWKAAPGGIVLKRAYHPFWRASIFGKPVALEATGGGQILADMDKEGLRDLVLHFAHPMPPWIWISVCAAAVCAVLITRKVHAVSHK